MREYKLEITKKLEDLYRGGNLDNVIAVLNLPSANYCEKRAEKIDPGDGILVPACHGCVAKGITSGDPLEIDEIKKVIDFFAKEYDTRFITINGRGDPFHPELKELNLNKIRYARDKYGIRPYVFSAGNNLDEGTCQTLADYETNVMISLFGNPFIDADFFAGKDYPESKKPIQNQAEIAKNLRTLIGTYMEHHLQTEEGTARIGMNYVVSERDIANGGEKIRSLKEAANENRIFFLVSTNFDRHPDYQTQKKCEEIAYELSDFHLKHSIDVFGTCGMGAGSSMTVDCDGMILTCPYVPNESGDGRFQESTLEEIGDIVRRYRETRDYSCAVRWFEEMGTGH